MHIRNSRSTRRAGVVAASAAMAFTLLPAVAATATPTGSASIENDTLTVTGTGWSERLALRLAPGDLNTLQVDFGDDGSAEHSFDRTAFSNIVVVLRSGDDAFRVDQTNGAFADEALAVYGGSGHDTIDSGDGNDMIFGGSGRDTVNGHRGVDTAFLGSGQDSFRWDPGDGSDVVNGDSGTDTLLFFGSTASEGFTLSANGPRQLFERNVGTIRMDMDDIETLALGTLAGADTVTINDMAGTGFRRAELDLSGPTGAPDGEVDRVTISGTEKADNVHVRADGPSIAVTGARIDARIVGADTNDALQIDTLGGNDRVRVDDAVNAVVDVRVDLGPGQH